MPQLPERLGSRFAAYYAGIFGIALARWIGNTFGDTTLEQVLWHLRYTEHAAVQMGSLFLVEFCFEVLLFPALFALTAALVHAVLAERIRAWPRRVLRSAPVLTGVVAIGVLLAQFSVFSYAAAQLGPDRFAALFVDPTRVALQPRGKPRNLVLIYAESMEKSYGDPELFGRDLLASLHAVGGFSFADYRPMPGATWTIAAMVATQCGVPLKVYSEAELRSVPGRKSFLPGATCLGDLLQAHGWRNVFMGGAPLSFAGKGAFLRDHGYDERWGRRQWQGAGVKDGDMNEWGLTDHALFERARQRLAELHAEGKPFNLTLLTMDTHNPHGFYSPYCLSDGAGDFEGIVSCSSDQIAAFVADARRQGLLKDTTVVVIGDHLAVPNPAWEELQRAGDARRIFNLFLADDLPEANRSELLPFDLYPSLLELVGMDVVGDRLGLGYSAFGPLQVTLPADRAASWSLAAVQGSPTYDRLWQEQAPPPALDPAD